MNLDDHTADRVLLAVTEYRDLCHRIEEKAGYGSRSHPTSTRRHDEARAKRIELDTLLADVRASEGT